MKVLNKLIIYKNVQTYKQLKFYQKLKWKIKDINLHKLNMMVNVLYINELIKMLRL